MPNLCLCTPCVNGIPYQWKVSISGTTNGSCTGCGNANGDFILNYISSCNWSLGVGGICQSSGTLKLSFAANASGGVDMTVEFDTRGGATQWTATNLPDCLSPTSLTLVGSGTADCNWPSTISVTPIGP